VIGSDAWRRDRRRHVPTNQCRGVSHLEVKKKKKNKKKKINKAIPVTGRGGL
jgi:hypothetical protein